jgi:hypothetical protein
MGVVFVQCLCIEFVKNTLPPLPRLTLSYSSEINAVLCPQSIYLPLKKTRDMSLEVYPAHPVGCYILLQINLLFGALFILF